MSLASFCSRFSVARAFFSAIHSRHEGDLDVLLQHDSQVGSCRQNHWSNCIRCTSHGICQSWRAWRQSKETDSTSRLHNRISPGNHHFIAIIDDEDEEEAEDEEKENISLCLMGRIGRKGKITKSEENVCATSFAVAI